MKRQDALFNWLQMKVVSTHRPDDQAAKDTLAFFETILAEDHQLQRFTIEHRDEQYYEIAYSTDDGEETIRFDRELVDQLLIDIEANPKFNE